MRLLSRDNRHAQINRSGRLLRTTAAVIAGMAFLATVEGTMPRVSQAASTAKGWVFRDSLGVSVPFNGLSFVSPTEGWVTGASGTILHTTDGGKNWVAQNSGTTHWLQSVSFSDASHGWIAGNDGTILATSDGGQTWSPQDSGVKFDLYTITFLNSREGWAGGFAGTLLHTTDGGATWNKVSTETAQWIMNIYFLKSNPQNGWAVGQDGLVLVTRDGGATWTKKNNSIAKDLYGVYFRDANNGWAVGTHGVIQFTANGGDTWTIQNGLGRGPLGRGVEGRERELNDLHAISFIDDKTGYAVGVLGLVMKTVDGGNHWTIVPCGTGLDLYNIAFPTSSDGWIVGVGGMILHKGS
ncbi:YCF48-related protein [Leptospirillum ferriphilum]|uniref:WD40/YVTN/BNR-like repeat-containing protein n=1 Tax=Leptospirillum ferriphilum TaxID=178606 RepID=UPI003EE5A36C